MFDSRVSRNAYNVCKNPFQTDSKKVLCVCSAGCLRSPTAANILHTEYGYNTRSAGVSDEYAIVPLSGKLLTWADEIVVMESWHVHEIEAVLERMESESNKFIRPNIVYLDIPDDYGWMEDSLVELIKERYAEYLESLDKEDE